MANVFTNPLTEHLQSTRRKPDTDYQERLKQAQRIKAIANIMSLVGQGVFAPKGANILPMEDKVTPFAMNEFGRMREDEIKRGDYERQVGLNAMMKDIEYDVSQADKDKQAKLRAEEAEKQRAFQEAENAKYRSTPEQQLEQSIARGGQTSENQLRLAQEQSRLRQVEMEQRHQNTLREIKTRSENPTSRGNQNYILTIDDPEDKKKYQFTQYEVKDLFSLMMNDESIAKELEKNNPKAYYEFLYKGNVPDEGFITTKIREHWPKIKGKMNQQGQSSQSSQVDNSKIKEALNKVDQIIGPNSKIPKAKQKDAFFEVFTWAGLTTEQIEQLWAKANQ